MKEKGPEHSAGSPALWDLKTALIGAPFFPEGASLRRCCRGSLLCKQRNHPAWRSGARGLLQRRAGSWGAGGPSRPLTAMHCRMMQLCFIRPGPPNFFMSLQKWHSPHSVRRQASHLRHRVRRRRAPAVARLAANFTAEAGPSFPLGLPMARFCRRTHRTGEMRGCRAGQTPSRRHDRLTCIPSPPQNIYICQRVTPGPQNGTLRANRVFTEATERKPSHWDGPEPTMTGVLLQGGNVDTAQREPV